MPKHLLAGLQRFHEEQFPRFREHYERLAREGQRPSTLFIGCSDSRLVPTLLTDTLPGELFMVRNMGAFVPPFESDHGHHGTSAAIEFATLTLEVTDIVICGHTHCGAIQALYQPPDAATPNITRWIDLAREARLDEEPSEPVLRRTEQRAIILQVSRLLTFPMVRERVEAGRLSLHGWHYIIEGGRVDVLDVDAGEFRPMEEG